MPSLPIANCSPDKVRSPNQLNNREQYQFLHFLIRRIDYDGRTGEIEIFFHETGIEAIDQVASPQASGNVA